MKIGRSYTIDFAREYPPKMRERMHRKMVKTLDYITDQLLAYPNVRRVFENIEFEINDTKYIYTDGRIITLDAWAVLKYDLTYLSEIIIHEFLHIVLGHPIRARKYTIMPLFNFAADIMVDSIASKYIFGRRVYHLRLLERLLVESLKKEGMSDKAGLVRDLIEEVAENPSMWSTEKIYVRLLRIFDEKDLLEKFVRIIAKILSSIFKELHAWGKYSPYGDGDEYGLFTLALQYKVLETIINRSEGPDWISILRKLLVLKKDRGPITSWRKPNRKLLVHGAYYPVKTNMMLNRLVLAVDVSGSISDEDYKKLSYEVAGLINKVGVYELYIIQFDADIVHVSKHVQPGLWDVVKALEMRYGAGGTRFVPVFNYVDREIGDVDAIVFFTDGEGEYPPYTPKYKTIWVLINSRITPPFGEVVYV